jgi:hypothetical protein
LEYLALIHAEDEQWESMSEDDRQAVYAQYMEFSDSDQVVGGAELQSTKTATSVRIRGSERLVTDGPYAEVKEALGGYFILECGSIDEACELAARIPAAEQGAVEVRPVHVEEAS